MRGLPSEEEKDFKKRANLDSSRLNPQKFSSTSVYFFGITLTPGPVLKVGQ